jgi:hypothetical protein
MDPNNVIVLELLGIVGIAIHYLKDWNIANNQGVGYNIKKAIPTIILSVLTTCVLIFLRDSFKDIYPVTPLGAVILGYLGDSVFFSFVNVKKPNFPSN